MSTSRRRFALQLALTPGIGGRTLTRILARTELLGHAPDEFLKLPEEVLREEYALPREIAGKLASSAEHGDPGIDAEEDRLEQLGVRLVTAADADYPIRLEQFDEEAPPLLFLYGNLKLLEAKTFCVLSSRGAPASALERIESLAEDGVLNAEVLVSGHNRAEYQRSAVVPLQWGSPRILCLDRGLFQVLGDQLDEEPFRAARLWRYKFDPSTDLAVSPVRPGAGFGRVSNRVRDRLVAGLSERIDFVYIRDAGNMERLARMALKAGRQVRVSEWTPEPDRFQALGAQIISEGSRS